VAFDDLVYGGPQPRQAAANGLALDLEDGDEIVGGVGQGL
jgi:hypothetical protein